MSTQKKDEGITYEAAWGGRIAHHSASGNVGGAGESLSLMTYPGVFLSKDLTLESISDEETHPGRELRARKNPVGKGSQEPPGYPC